MILIQLHLLLSFNFTFLFSLLFHLSHLPAPYMKVAAGRTIHTAAHEAYARDLSATRHKIQHSWVDEDHPGCQLSGFLLVDRAPGNFHIQAQSRGHDLAAHMTNVSHIINHLSFGNPFSQAFINSGLKNTPPRFLESTKPFDGNVYVTHNDHEAHHHYMKVVTTEFDVERLARSKGTGLSKSVESNRAYQILQSSQLSLYKADIVPGEIFSFERLHKMFTNVIILILLPLSGLILHRGQVHLRFISHCCIVQQNISSVV